MPDISIAAAGRTFPGYLAVPSTEAPPSGQWPGVVVIHEAFGLNADVKSKADEFAAHGYLALAPDLYGGKSWATCIRNVFRQLRAGSGPAFAVLDAARAQLAGRPDCTGKVGVIGFCLGGGFALLCAPREGFDAAAVNYGEVPEDAETVLRGACAVVGNFGGRDPMGIKHPDRLERALTVLDISHDVKVYPGAGHRFLTRTTGALGVFAKMTKMDFREADAADAWQRIYAFFGEHLSG